jgi:multimeric flavodoxin WrbA
MHERLLTATDAERVLSGSAVSSASPGPCRAAPLARLRIRGGLALRIGPVGRAAARAEDEDRGDGCQARETHSQYDDVGASSDGKNHLASRGDTDREDTVSLTDFQQELSTTSRWDFSDLRALFVNCTLKPSPELSHTEGLMRISMAIMETNGVEVDFVRAVDHELTPGVWPDMREHGAARDDWPALFERVQAADILVLGSPIWLGEKSSVCTRVIERLYACSSLLNEHGQYAFYGKVGGCLITGNEDGIKHCSMNILYSLQHLGYTIPPQADAGWIGEAGPGPSYLDEGSGGPDNDFTNRNATFMTWNLLHLARMLKHAGGVPAHGNQRSLWDAGCRFDFPNPEHR